MKTKDEAVYNALMLALDVLLSDEVASEQELAELTQVQADLREAYTLGIEA
jgi:hypothetical protein